MTVIDRAPAPAVDRVTREAAGRFRGKRTGTDEDDAASRWNVTRDERTVGMGTEALKVPVTNDLGVGQHALAQSEQRRIALPVERGEERFELRLHFRLADQRRAQSAHDFEEQPVGLGVRHDRRVGSPSVIPLVAVGLFREKGDFAQTRAPKDSPGGYW